MAGVIKRAEAEVRKSADYGMRLSKPPQMHSEAMRQKLNFWMTLEKRRVMARLCMMYRCVLKEDECMHR